VTVLEVPCFASIYVKIVEKHKNLENGFLESIKIYLDLKLFQNIQYGLKFIASYSKQCCIKFLQNPDWKNI